MKTFQALSGYDFGSRYANEVFLGHALRANLQLYKWFQIRGFCTGQESNLTLFPYECRLPFRDVLVGGVQLRAKYREGDDRMTVWLTINSRRPARYSHYLPEILRPGPTAIFERHATEADFGSRSHSERYAGIVESLGDRYLQINVSISMSCST